MALSNRTGRTNLWVPSGGASAGGRASLEPQTRADSGWSEQSVATYPLDDFELDDVGFFKIDVEGHELAVLQGATNLLKTQRPIVMIEIEQHADRKGPLDEIIDFFADHSYSGEFLQKGHWCPIGELDRQRTQKMAMHVARHGYGVNLLWYARRMFTISFFDLADTNLGLSKTLRRLPSLRGPTVRSDRKLADRLINLTAPSKLL